METRDHENSTLGFLTEESTISPEAELRERIKIEFYKTYDVMTGIRIAATLGGFFSMMILLVLYKNYCKPSKTLSEEQLNAAVTAAAEEEDRALQAALEATSFYTALSKPRQSLENTNQVLLSPRFSSVGGGYSHLTPPLKMAVLQQRGKSLPGSVMHFSSSDSPSTCVKNGKEICQVKADLDYQPPDYFNCRNQLNVPLSRRVSSVTCSSADSSYLERRCSAFEMGLPPPPHFVRQSREKLSGKKEEPWDYYYPIDIQVIQPTPEMSPTASERNLQIEEQSSSGLQVPGFQDQMHRLSVSSIDIGLAPLASISSLGSFSSQSSSIMSKSLNATTSNQAEYVGCTCGEDSLGSDSVFMDELEDDEIEDFATDSEFEYDGFDDDYSFCESKPRPVSRTEMRTLKFASFDSYDASITRDSVSEEETLKANEQSDDKSSTQVVHKQHSSELKKQPSLHEGNKLRKKLVKTYSEPRNSKVVKQLPAWTEKGRSGYIPKRQLSSPSSRKKNLLEGSKENKDVKSLEKFIAQDTEKAITLSSHKKPPQEEENTKDLLKFKPPPSPNTNNSDSQITSQVSIQRSGETSTSLPKQGLNIDLPSKTAHQLSLPNTQEKRSRLQKQKNFIEEVKVSNETKEKTEGQHLTGTDESISFPVTSGGLLKPPDIGLRGSCERLTDSSLCEEGSQDLTEVEINVSTVETKNLGHCVDSKKSSTSLQDPQSE